MNKGLYGRLAASNIRSNKQFYFPYLLTGIITVAMFYTINALADNPGIGNMPGGRDMEMILRMGIGVIGLFAIIFLFYTNSFIMKRRKKELGIYNILGMEKKHIAKILAIETVFAVLIAVTGGLSAGIVFNKLMCMFLYRLMGIDAVIPFYISKSGIGITVILFVGIYLLTFLYDLLEVKLANPIELLRSQSAGEKEPKTKAVMAVLGLICLGIGYGIAITTENPIQVLLLFFVAVILVIIGTYLLFTAGSIAFLKILRKRKSYYYKTRHFTAVSGMIYRMKQNAVGLANICVLSTMVLVVVSTTVSLYIGVDDILKSRYPKDIMVRTSYAEAVSDGTQITEAVEAAVKESGRKIRSQSTRISLYFMAKKRGDAYVLERHAEYEELTGIEVVTREQMEADYGKKIDPLENNEIVLLAFDDETKENLTINDQTYHVRETVRVEPDTDTADMMRVLGNYYIIVVERMEDLTGFYQLQAAAYGDLASSIVRVYQVDIDGTDEEKKACFANMQTHLAQVSDPLQIEIYSECRQDNRDHFHSLYGGFFFLGLYLGALFLMITVLIIFYKQISEGYDDKERFAIMEKVGMSSQEVKASISTQVRTVFLLPILMAAVHIAAAFPMIKRLLTMFNLHNTMLFALCVGGTFLVFLVIYLLVFLQTSRVYYRIVGEHTTNA